VAKKSGRQGAVYMNPTGTQPMAVVGMSNWKLSYKTDFIDVTSFGATNKETVPGLPSITGSFTGFWDTAETKPFATAKFASGGFFYGYVDTVGSATAYAYGPMYANCDIDVPVNGAVTVSGTFEASGAWYIGL
jgi:hypothetical protein